jgi:hypothetical protein
MPAHCSPQAALSSGALRQSTNRLLMVAPTAFGWNPQAAADNAYMGRDDVAAAGSALTRQVGGWRGEGQVGEGAGGQGGAYTPGVHICWELVWEGAALADSLHGSRTAHTHPLGMPGGSFDQTSDICPLSLVVMLGLLAHAEHPNPLHVPSCHPPPPHLLLLLALPPPPHCTPPPSPTARCCLSSKACMTP